MRIRSVFVYGCTLSLLFGGSVPRKFSEGYAAEPPAKPKTTLSVYLKEQGYTPNTLLETTEHGMFLVKVVLDGKPFTLMVDTGAAVMVALGKKAGKTLGFESDTHRNEKLTDSNLISSQKYGIGTVEDLTVVSGGYRVRSKRDLRILDGFSLTAGVLNPKSGKIETVEVDGLLGQLFLQAHCAVIDSETSTLFLIDLYNRELPKLLGRWECVRGEQDGKPLVKASDNWIEFQSDGASECFLFGRKAKGYLQVHRPDVRRILRIGRQGEKALPQILCQGNYSVDGDSLKLTLIDESRKEAADAEWVSKSFPYKFESKKDSGHVYYEFKRKTE